MKIQILAKFPNILKVGWSLNNLLDISNETLEKAQEWFTVNELLVNIDKTNYDCFRTKMKNNTITEMLQVQK